MTTKTTVQLQPGDRVRIGLKIVRTVESVRPSGYVANYKGEQILTVRYAEGKTPEWSSGEYGSRI